MGDTPHRFTVAGALVEGTDGLLLVQNRRRNGRVDWTTPGGVIDADDPSLRHGLAREVEEETGLVVAEWRGPIYSVEAVAPDLGWHLAVEVHYAIAFSGEVRVEDPDGIVVGAEWVDPAAAAERLSGGARWVGEPLLGWMSERWDGRPPRQFHYEVRGSRFEELLVDRIS